MQKRKLMSVGKAILLGLVFFAVVMGAAMGVVMLNVHYSPGVPWFVLPLIVLIAVPTWWAQRRWSIGLAVPGGPPLFRVYIVGVALTVVGVCVVLLQGKSTGMVRATETLDADVSSLFVMTYAIYMSVFVAILAEVTFRGVIQSRIQQVLGVWQTVLVVAVVNVLAHRWGPEITLNWLGLFVTLAGWTYLRWLAGSLWPPLILHAGTNLVVALGLWFTGPFEHETLSDGGAVIVAIIGIAALGIALRLARAIRHGDSSQEAPGPGEDRIAREHADTIQ